MKISFWREDRYSRRKEQDNLNAPLLAPDAEPPSTEWRSAFQKDYDRLLFSTPVRRLADKTQVWPMEQNDGVRTRLTHSHEVANLARSIGLKIAKSDVSIFEADFHNVISPILSAISLAHDLGNPPFGHRGEAAIGKWFQDRQSWIFSHDSSGGTSLSCAIPNSLYPEFTEFDGNPQTLRLLTKLQTSISHVGLDLTAATISACIKYPVRAENVDKNNDFIKKCGYFESERDVVEWSRNLTGIAEKQRHPLTWIMEACDDIAYSVLDVDDVMKKGIISPDDILHILHKVKDLKGHDAITKIENAFKKVDEDLRRRKEIARDIKIGYLRAFLIEALVIDASNAFIKNKSTIYSLQQTEPLLKNNCLCETLKGVASQYAFNNCHVLRTEAQGAAAINDLMTFFWDAISNRKKIDALLSKRSSAKASYAFSLISHNYVEDALRDFGGDTPSKFVRYKELRLLTDMVSGMTDGFAINLWQDLKSIPDVHST